MISIPDTSTLVPVREGDNLYLFPFSGTELVKLDLLFEAGSAYQQHKLCASATAKLMTMATQAMDSASLAEFMDFRGIVFETNSEVHQTMLTFYFLRHYADELMPVVCDMVCCPRFDDGDFEVWRNRRRQEIMQQERKTSTMARRTFYEAIFGREHPLGGYATAADIDRLTTDDIKAHHAAYYGLDKMTVVAAGNVEGLDLHWLTQGASSIDDKVIRNILPPPINSSGVGKNIVMPDATQTSLRVGRILPLAWDSMDYARFMLLTTVLGGYFGSRLMSNIREDKGYTYGIYARTQIYRGVIVFFITADVAGGMAQAALDEVNKELELLCKEPVADEELKLVKTVLAGDFLRSVDGIFEKSARYCDMLGTCVDERLTDNLRSALQDTTPAQLQELAQRFLNPSDMTVCLAGAL